MTDRVFVECRASDGVATVTLNRSPVNVLNISMLREFESVLEEQARERGLRVLVVRAEGKVFSAGVDVADHTAEKAGEMIPLFDRVCTSLLNFPVPTLAAVHGHALGGGCEVALCCDLIYASENAKFGQPEIKLASVAPIAALMLPGLVGYRHAAGMLFSGESISAAEAARIGLINRVLPPDGLEAAVKGQADQLASLSAVALRLSKKTLRMSRNAPNILAEMEKLYLHGLMSTEDAHEGLAAFLEKRAPRWKHK